VHNPYIHDQGNSYCRVAEVEVKVLEGNLGVSKWVRQNNDGAKLCDRKWISVHHTKLGILARRNRQDLEHCAALFFQSTPTLYHDLLTN
jgi:hypothetical protein